MFMIDDPKEKSWAGNCHVTVEKAKKVCGTIVLPHTIHSLTLWCVPQVLRLETLPMKKVCNSELSIGIVTLSNLWMARVKI